MKKTYLTKNSVSKWVALLLSPIVLLGLVAMLQLTSRFLFTLFNPDVPVTGASSPFILVVNVLSIILGVISVLLLILAPVWLVMIFESKKKT